MKSDEVPIGNITFDPTTRMATLKGGQPAQLRNKSKEVLRYLVEHPGRTVTKDEIIGAVWSDVVVSDESLVQCIADIRRVIGDCDRKIVETVPREGYRLHLPSDGEAIERRPSILAFVAVVVFLGLGWFLWPGTPDDPPTAQQRTEMQAASVPPGTSSTEAYLEVLKGRVSANRFDSEESLIAERHFRRAIELDPDFARAYAELGTLFAVRFENNWTVLREADKGKALYFAEKAVDLDPDLWLAHYALGRLQSVFAKHEVAEAHLERAMELEPENEDARAYYAIVRNFRGDAEGAMAILEPTLKSHPNPPYWYYLGLGNALFNLGRNEAAEMALITCVEKSANSPYCLRYLIAVYGELGRFAEAKATIEAYESVGFDPSVEAVMNVMTFHAPTDQSRLEAALRSAGMAE